MGVIDTRNREKIQNNLKLGLADMMAGKLKLPMKLPMALPKPALIEKKKEEENNNIVNEALAEYKIDEVIKPKSVSKDKKIKTKIKPKSDSKDKKIKEKKKET
mgnify:CR=1 FL=1